MNFKLEILVNFEFLGVSNFQQSVHKTLNVLLGASPVAHKNDKKRNRNFLPQFTKITATSLKV